jgi:hypothetical protein
MAVLATTSIDGAGAFVRIDISGGRAYYRPAHLARKRGEVARPFSK